MLRTKTGILATMLALSLAGWVGCGDDDGGGDDGSGTGTDTGTGTGTGSGDGGDGSDDGGSGSDGGGTDTDEETGTDTDEETGTDTDEETGTETGTETETGTGSSSGSGTGSVACEDIQDREECLGTWGCNWQGGGGSGECVPFDGDCSDFGQQHCEAMVECVWNEQDEECTDA